MAHSWHTPSLADIESQKHWELEGVERGVRKVRAEIEAQNVGDSQLGSALIQRTAPKLIQHIAQAQVEAEQGLAASTGSRGRVPPWWYIILMLPADKLAVITIKKIMSFRPRDFTLCPALTGLASDISRSVLDQLEYEDWRKEDKERVDRFFENYTLNSRNLKRLRERLEGKREQRWDNATGVQFGTRLLMLLCEAMPEWFSIEQARLRGGRWEYQFVFTESARDTLFKMGEQSELSQPSLMPMICQPADWRVAA